MCPQRTLKRGELPPLATRPRVGPKTLVNPQPTGVGKTGVQGGKAPWQGVWGMCPQRTLKESELPTLATRPRVGPKTLANPQPTGVGKTGVQGAKPPGRGFGGCAPKNIKGGELPPLATCPRVGPKTLANPQPTMVGKTGVQGGEAPMAGGLGDVPPRTLKGASCPP